MNAPNLTQLADQFHRDGYFVSEQVIDDAHIEQLRQAVVAIPDREEVRRKRSPYGVRNLLEVCPAVRDLAADPRVRQFATAVLGEAAFAVRAIFFDKVLGANWPLAWHQDKAITVKQRLETPGFSAWSQKVGVWQTQPPAEVLANMIALRVHLDDCGADNGPLRVLPGAHRHGWLDHELDDWKANVPAVTCTVLQGGIVGMCPLSLHASAAAETATHRRVIHIEYAAVELPGELQWNQRVGKADETDDG